MPYPDHRQCQNCGRWKPSNSFKLDWIASLQMGQYHPICRPCENRPTPRPGSVYIVQCEQYFKIGSSFTPNVKRFQTDNPLPVKMRFIFPSRAMRTVERALHQRFVAYHHRDEWFILPPDVIAWLDSVTDIDMLIENTVPADFVKSVRA